jgi:excisionase family DNA binding protein
MGAVEKNPAPVDHFWTAQDLAAVLQVASGTVYTWVSQGRLPAQRVNGCLRFDPADVRAWLDGQRRSIPPLPFESAKDTTASTDAYARTRVIPFDPGRDKHRK